MANKEQEIISGSGEISGNVGILGQPIDTNITNTPSVDTGLMKDKFGLLSVASPVTLFDAQFTYDLQPLLYEQVTPTGSTITHDSTNRCVNISVNTSSVIDCFMQSYEYFRYQPGKAQRIYITFNFNGAATDCTKYAQYGDDNNAFRLELREDGTAWAGIITSTSQGNNLVQITTSGIDWTKEQILIIEFEALYVGSVGFSLQLQDTITEVVTINNSNNSDFPYIATANLPIRVGIETDGTGTANSDVLFNCTSVQSSGGVDETVGYDFKVSNNITASSGTRTHITSIRPKLTFNSIENRVKIVLIEVELLVTGNSPIEWDLSIGQALTSASYSDVNTTYSAVEFDTAGTLSGSAAIEIDGGYVASTNQNKGAGSKKITQRYPITLDAAGAQRSLGTITLSAQGIGGNSACIGMIKWREIR